MRRYEESFLDRRNARSSHALPLSVLLAVIACGGQVAVAEAPVNKMCPVMTLEEADPAITTEYGGKTVAFCCDTCLKKFQANPERYISQWSAFGGTGDDHAEHDHALSGEVEGTEHEHGPGEPAMPFLARLHPVLIHLPLASVPLATVGLLAWLGTHKRLFADADVPPMVLAAGSSVLAVITGNKAHDSMRFSDALHDYVHWHQYSATTLMVLLLILTGLRLWRWRRLDGSWLAVYLAGLLIGSGLVVVVGFLGGSLVFGPDHLRP